MLDSLVDRTDAVSRCPLFLAFSIALAFSTHHFCILLESARMVTSQHRLYRAHYQVSGGRDSFAPETVIMIFRSLIMTPSGRNEPLNHARAYSCSLPERIRSIVYLWKQIAFISDLNCAVPPELTSNKCTTACYVKIRLNQN